jgi:hypothetical protein
MPPELLHLLLKWSPARRADTIEVHQRIAERAGVVWWGAISRSVLVSTERLQVIEAQLQRGQQTYAFLYRTGDEPDNAYVVRALIRKITTAADEVDEERRPDYYTKEECRLFVLLSDFEELPRDWVPKHLVLASRPAEPISRGALQNQTNPLFVAERPSPEDETGLVGGSVWWVNQGTSYRVQRDGGYLWAPVRTQGGYSVRYHTNVAELSPGDVVVHYANGAIRALGEVIGPGGQRPRPPELPDRRWGDEGHYAPVRYHELEQAIRISDVPSRTADAGPFTKDGDVKEGYLFALTPGFAETLQRTFASRWPPGSPWATGERSHQLFEGDEQSALREQVEWVSDSPADDDLLRRRPLARALATRMRRLREDEPRTSFLIHVDGPWGAGKSTLLNFLRADLKRDWLVVEFDAWRQSNVGPAWWALLAALRHDLAQSLPRWIRIPLRVAEAVARIRRAGAPYMLALSLLFVVAAGMVLLLRPRQFDWKATGDLVLTAVAVLSALGTLGAGALVAVRFLLWDSARGARLFEQSNTNPMQEVADHFAWLLRRVGRPVVFLIDDLDRCPERYVVELLDAVQTLLRDALKREPDRDGDTFETYFVVAADGAWIRTSYEVAYQTFALSVAEPGRPLGYLFLDKLFQLTVPVPILSSQAQDAYLKALLHTTDAAATESPVQAEAQAVRQSVQESTSEGEVVEVLRQASPSVRHLVAEDAVDRLSAPEVETATEHVLQRFAPLVDANPRSMKRFLNSYSVLRAVRTLEGNTIASEPLALWTILQTRWPSLADYLRRQPEAIEYAGKAEHAETIPKELRPLLDLPEFQRLLAFSSVPLTAEVIRACCGSADAPDGEP